MGVAAVLVVADLFQAAGLDKEAVRNNLDYFAGQVSGCEAGFASGRFLTLIKRFADVWATCGKYSERQNRLARHPGWLLKDWTCWNGAEDALKDAANLESSRHMVSYKFVRHAF